MRRRSKIIAALVGVAAFAAGMTTQALHERPAPDAAAHWGDPLPMAVAVYPQGAPNRLVSERLGCELAALGMYPWARQGEGWSPRRSFATLEGLEAAGIPERLRVRFLNAMIAMERPTVVSLSNLGGIGSDGATYQPRFSIGYQSPDRGYVMCHDSRLIFASDLRETYCLVWTIEGYTAGYCLACNNLVRLYPGPLKQRGGVMQRERPMAVVHELPEPGTAGLVVAGLVGLLAAARKRG